MQIYFTGGSSSDMERLYGLGRIYRQQCDGAFGQRIATAVHQSFQSHANRVMVIATDCPSLTVDLLSESIAHLSSHDVVIGPSVDGGYYLIGTTHDESRLFENMPWSTRSLFAETLKVIRQLEYSVKTLRELTDIDRPEDLPIWIQIKKETHAE